MSESIKKPYKPEGRRLAVDEIIAAREKKLKRTKEHWYENPTAAREFEALWSKFLPGGVRRVPLGHFTDEALNGYACVLEREMAFADYSRRRLLSFALDRVKAEQTLRGAKFELGRRRLGPLQIKPPKKPEAPKEPEAPLRKRGRPRKHPLPVQTNGEALKNPGNDNAPSPLSGRDAA